MKPVFLLLTATFLFTLGLETASAAIVGTDDASHLVYDDGWMAGDDGATTGDAFGAWTFNSADVAGHFVGNSTNLDGGSGADINVAGESFGMFGLSPGFATADRSFNGALSAGQSFSVDLAVNFRNGNKGINIFDGGTEILNFTVGSDDYVVNSAATGNGSIGDTYSANTAFNLTISQTAAGNGTWTITRSGGVVDVDSGTFNGTASGFQLFVAGTGGGGPSDLYFNNLAVSGAAVAVPEPSSAIWLMAAMCGIGIRRRSR